MNSARRLGSDIKLALDVAERGHQLPGGVVAVNAGEGGIRAEVMAIRRGLEDALDGVLEDAAVFLLGLAQLALDFLADGDLAR